MTALAAAAELNSKDGKASASDSSSARLAGSSTCRGARASAPCGLMVLNVAVAVASDVRRRRRRAGTPTTLAWSAPNASPANSIADATAQRTKKLSHAPMDLGAHADAPARATALGLAGLAAERDGLWPAPRAVGRQRLAWAWLPNACSARSRACPAAAAIAGTRHRPRRRGSGCVASTNACSLTCLGPGASRERLAACAGGPTPAGRRDTDVAGDMELRSPAMRKR